MKKIILLSLFLIGGLLLSQILPTAFEKESYDQLKFGLDGLMFICLAFIMINVGREFELDKKHWRSYISDYFIAMTTAAAPWIMVTVYYMFILGPEYMGSWDAWKENLLIGRFAAPTSAGILFTMLAAAGLRHVWIYKKTQVLAIFDDLDTILLMIPLQVMLIGMKWQLFVIVGIITFLLWFGWKKLSS
ncbi:MAG: sodium:proton antiporter, partial [Bacteroidales bacterium]